MINAIIVDDEAHARKTLELILKKLPFEISIIDILDNADDALEVIKNKEFDILFLDIEMPNKSGFDLLNQLEKINFSIIFTTAYNEYAIKAFKYTAFDYLLKPIGLQDLEECINRWQQLKNINNHQQINYLKDIIDNHKQVDKIIIPTKDGHHLISINEIIYCKADSNYSAIYLDDNKNIFVSKTLKEIEHLLSSFNFERVHKSYLINTQKIKLVDVGKDYFITMENNEVIPISRTKHHLFENIKNQ